MPATAELLAKIQARQAVVGVVGLGYVGLPLALRFAEEGLPVIGFDVDPAKPEAIAKGETYIQHVPAQRIQAARAAGRFEATVDFARAAVCDALLLCVPTPLGKHREPDLSYVTGTVESLLPHLRPGQLVCLESTTYPGTTEEELLPRMESAGLIIGETAFLAFSPEREDPGNPNFTTRNIPKVVGGATPACLEVAVALYGSVIDQVVPVSSLRAAELAKLLENIYRAVNIGLVNELKTVADAMEVDIWEVIDAAATKPFGFTPFYPGPGLGGHCIPIDPFYLTWKAHEVGVHTRFIELAGEVNSRMPQWVVQKLVHALNARGQAVRGARILVLGLAYKKNVDDSRESPSFELIERLQALGAEVAYSDPHVPRAPKKRAYDLKLESVPLTAENLQGFDGVLIATDHDAFDYEFIAREARLIVDTRGRLRGLRPNVVPA